MTKRVLPSLLLFTPAILMCNVSSAQRQTGSGKITKDDGNANPTRLHNPNY
ncbi:MAG TPA: hypothetical protein VEZ17_11610 [Chitinophagaceae bacterium]|nr:hypothetical protein [Chitinophagaceae bacterium]